MTFPAALPEIPVTSFAPALAYYRDCLGFAIDWEDEDLGLAGLSQGAARLFVGASHYRAHMKTAGPSVVWINLDSCAEVDALYQRWHATGARLGEPPAENKPWRLYEFLASDPDGNILRVFHFLFEGAGEG